LVEHRPVILSSTLPNRARLLTPPSPVLDNVVYTPLHLHSAMFMDPGHARRPVLDVIVDIRFGSPTFGEWESVRLDDQAHHAVYLSEGLGNDFLALTDDATVVYLCSEGYQPDREHGIHPLDPGLGIEWPDGLPFLMSPKDAEAPTLASAARSGLLPAYERCAATDRPPVLPRKRRGWAQARFRPVPPSAAQSLSRAPARDPSRSAR